MQDATDIAWSLYFAMCHPKAWSLNKFRELLRRALPQQRKFHWNDYISKTFKATLEKLPSSHGEKTGSFRRSAASFFSTTAKQQAKKLDGEASVEAKVPSVLDALRSAASFVHRDTSIDNRLSVFVWTPAAKVPALQIGPHIQPTNTGCSKHLNVSFQAAVTYMSTIWRMIPLNLQCGRVTCLRHIGMQDT